MKNFPKGFWAGSAETLTSFNSSMANVEARLAETDQEDKFAPESLLTKEGNVGVVEISGHLVPGKVSAIHQMFGIQGYDNIKEALVEAVRDKDIASIMLYVNSGGGAVAGVRDTHELIRNVGQVKPVEAYTEFAGSAAYWLTSAASKITTGSTSINGSIGVLSIHQEYSKRLEQDGITTTVMRTGTYKALANPYEPLSETAKAEMQGRLDAIYDLFIQDVADGRGVSPLAVDKQMGQGREFLGWEAVDRGLVDSVGKVAEVISSLNRRHQTKDNMFVTSKVVTAQTLDNNANVTTLKEDSMKLNYTKEELEALASGVPVDGFEVEVAPETASVESAEPEAEVEDTEKTEVEATDKYKQLELELEAKAEELVQAAATIEAEKLEKASLRQIVESAISQMDVALNRKSELASLDTAELVAKYADTKQTLADTFKTRGVAKHTPSVEEEKASASASLADQRFLLQAKKLKPF